MKCNFSLIISTDSVQYALCRTQSPADLINPWCSRRSLPNCSRYPFHYKIVMIPHNSLKISFGSWCFCWIIINAVKLNFGVLTTHLNNSHKFWSHNGNSEQYSKHSQEMNDAFYYTKTENLLSPKNNTQRRNPCVKFYTNSYIAENLIEISRLQFSNNMTMACVKPYPHNQINADCISIIQFTERLISRVQFTLLKPYYFSLLGASLGADWNYEINDSLEIFKLLPECCFIWI